MPVTPPADDLTTPPANDLTAPSPAGLVTPSPDGVLTPSPDGVLTLSPDGLLTTTRTVRRRLDLTRPVPPTLVEECLRVAQTPPRPAPRPVVTRGPSGGAGPAKG